jgi:hypothetical protein
MSSKTFRSKIMNMDSAWLNDTQMRQLSMRAPSSAFGQDAMRLWPQQYPGLLSAETYRGCAIVLWMLYNQLRTQFVSLALIESTIDAAHQALLVSKSIPPGSDIQGGATLSLTNAWQRSHSGVSAQQAVEAFESESIYAAKKFVQAQQAGL